jgi:hypothetical protein
MKATSRATFYTDKPAPQRRRYLIESAIVSAALDHRTETEKLVPFGDCTISVWNSHADRIDEEFGKGFLGVRIVRVNAFTFRWQIDNETPGKAGVPIIARGQTRSQMLLRSSDQQSTIECSRGHSRRAARLS